MKTQKMKAAVTDATFSILHRNSKVGLLLRNTDVCSKRQCHPSNPITYKKISDATAVSPLHRSLRIKQN
jgi:hypothetical protein